ncbi:MAG: hypothetical protein M3327_08495 [Actinomycetota bacterium]|nr:hypothetical protein [Actinomycetota bacterium]
MALVLAGMGAAALIAAPAASAKEDVKATLITDIPLDAPAGTELKVAWRLFYVDENGDRRPFGANGVFVRLLSSSRAASEEGVAPVGAYDTGEYEATVVVPEGGIRDVQLGLTGWVSDANGTRRSDVIFPITNDPVPRSGPITSPAPDEPVAGASDTASPTWILVLATSLSVLALVIAAFVVLRRRYRATARVASETQPVLSPRASSRA